MAFVFRFSCIFAKCVIGAAALNLMFQLFLSTICLKSMPIICHYLARTNRHEMDIVLHAYHIGLHVLSTEDSSVNHFCNVTMCIILDI